MVKKVLSISTLIIFIILLSKNNKTILPVFNELDIKSNTEYQKIYLLFEDNRLNTNNFMEYFNNQDIRILSITPYINPIIKDKFKSEINYSFGYYSNEINIDKFKNYYKETLDKNNILNDNTEYIVNGIIIKKVLVYSSINVIAQFSKQYPNLKYSFNNTGPFKYMIA